MEAGNEGFHFHETGNPWLRVRAQGFARRSLVKCVVVFVVRSVRVRMISGMNAAGMLTALRQSSGVEICDIPPPSGTGSLFGRVARAGENAPGG